MLRDARELRTALLRELARVTGREAAEAVMASAGINDVEIVEIEGHLSDHYDPLHKRLALSSENYRGSSLAAVGVAAHESGHAIQHKVGYSMLHARMAMIPVMQIGNVRCTTAAPWPLLRVFFSKDELDKFGDQLSEWRSKHFLETYFPQAKPFPKVRELFQRLLAAVSREVNANHADVAITAGSAHARWASPALLRPSANLFVISCSLAS